MMGETKVELTQDTLANIHIMASLLDDKGRAATFGFMYGLSAKENILLNNRKKEAIQVQSGADNRKISKIKR